MKILLVGPYPPPHGGISTHVSDLRRALQSAGTPCCVLNSARVDLKFALNLARFAIAGWSIQVHTNGHNRNSWLLAGFCGLAGVFGRRRSLTLHSGMAPAYIAASVTRRRMARVVGSLFHRIVCVSEPIRDALVASGVPVRKIEVRPAFIELPQRSAELDASLRAWMQKRSPVLAVTLFFRPEYGFDLLLSAMANLRCRYPSIGCVVMGGGERREDAEHAVCQAGLEDHLLLAGDVSRDACLSVMAHSGLFLRPTYVDGDSISVREALALGIPVVASNAAPRPSGAVLFEAGSEEDLCEKIQSTLRACGAGDRPSSPAFRDPSKATERDHAIA